MLVTKPRLYLAGPAVFLPDAVSHGRAKKVCCARYGFEGRFPLDAELDLSGRTPFEQGLLIASANEQHMRDCDAVVADMTPFRGASMDVGTAYEMGFVRALGKPVFGYSNVAAGFRARTGTAERDAFGMVFESFDMAENLMLHGAVAFSGCPVVAADVPEAERFTSLVVFERVLELARERLGSN